MPIKGAKIEGVKVKVQKGPSIFFSMVGNDYPATTPVNQTLGKGGSRLHLLLYPSLVAFIIFLYQMPLTTSS